MAARIHLDITEKDLSQLATELRRLADFAQLGSKLLAENKDTLHTDGMKNVIDGLDSIARVMQKIHGKYKVPMPGFNDLRVRIAEEKNKKTAGDPQSIALKALEDADAIGKAQSPHRMKKSPASQESPQPRKPRIAKHTEKK